MTWACGLFRWIEQPERPEGIVADFLAGAKQRLEPQLWLQAESLIELISELIAG